MKTVIRMILALAVLGNVLRGHVLAANVYDAAVETHPNCVMRTNDAAVTARHLLWKKGSADTSVAVATASDIPLGTIDNVETGTGVRQTVHLLGKGDTKKMVAAEAIAAGEQVYAAAAGKVTDLPAGAGTYYCVGTALTAADADDDVIEVADCVPFAQVVT